MLNKKLLGSVSSPPSDDNFENVTLLLSGDGTNGAQNNTFLDSSTNNFTITRNGNTTQGSFSPYGDRWSNYLGSTSERLTTSSSSTAFSFGTGDFTIECWYSFRNPSETSVSAIFQMSTASTGYNASNSNTSALSWDRGGSRWSIYAADAEHYSSAVTAVAGVWYHLAIVRSSGTTKLYLNGTSILSVADTRNYSMTYCVLGAIFNNSYSMNGSVSNFRVVKGSAVYTANFTPPTAPLTAITNTSFLTSQSNRFIDNSSNAIGITVGGSPSVQRFSPFNPTAPYDTSVIGGSGYFDGSGDYLTVPSSSNLTLPNDFTVQFWLYGTLNGGANPSLVNNVNSSIFYETSGANRGLCLFSGSAVITTATTVLVNNQWNHIALVRSGTTGTNIAMFANGVRVGTATAFTGSVDFSSSFINRYFESAVGFLTGYMADLQIVKGTALYDPTSTTLTIPTAPLTAVTNTQFLCNFTNAGIPDLAMQNNLETVGNAQVSTSVKKYGTGSLAFDGSGDTLAVYSQQSFVFGTGDFTMEFWLYANALSGYQNLIDARAVDGTLFPTLFLNDSLLEFYANGSARASSTIATSTWYHIAVCRSGTSTKLFVNGTQAGSTYTDSNNYTAGSVLYIGRYGPSALNFLNGNIDDLRISKFARYTAAFTPPAQALPTY